MLMSGRAGILLIWTCASTACGGDVAATASSCATRYDCPSGQSCGTSDGVTFACAQSGALNPGDACNANQSLSLPLQCGDHLLCLGVNGVGTCQRWCSSSDPCTSGSCVTAHTTRGATIGFCSGVAATASSCETHYDCPAGESCGSLDGVTFTCSQSGALNAGDACNANQSLPLQCGDHLLCLGMNDVGTCQRWCSAGDPCDSGSCTTVHTTRGTTIGFCQ